VTLFAYLALFGWIPAVLVLFALVPGRRAAAAAVVGGWLFLPPYLFPIENLPDFSKNTAATIGMALGTLIFRPDRILAFRPRWFDLPMVAWCSCGMISSLHNGLGVYDGLSDMLGQVINWGLPYLLGRLYFADLDGLRDFTVAMVIGGLIYVLPCLWEIRMSPQLLYQIYGAGGWQGIRLGGYRPHVFFGTGLELGMWMTTATLVAWWLWRCGVLKRVGSVPFGAPLLILAGTTVMCRSTGALFLLVAGAVALWSSTRLRTGILLWTLILFEPIYGGLRIPNLWSGRHAVDLVTRWIDEERGQSLRYRLQCEDMLIAKAIQQPVFGWGGWGRSAAYDEWGYVVPTDGMWIVILGIKGFVGLGLLYLALELPAILFLRNFPVQLWAHPRVAPAAAAAALLGICMIDLTMNGFLNLIYVTLAGGLIGVTPAQLGVDLTGERGRGARGRAGGSRRGGAAAARTTGGTMSAGLNHNVPASPPYALATSSGAIHQADRWRSAGRTLKAEGRLAEAETAWRQALDLLTALGGADSGAPDLRQRWCDCANDLAWLQLNHPDPARCDPAAAVALSRQVVETCPDCGTYWNTLGAAYLRTGDYDLAIAALKRSTTLGNGSTAFDDVFLAMAHARLGNLEEAGERLAQATLRMEQDYPGHPELTRFCDEARSLLSQDSEIRSAAL
jgi:tetratricopeptide (TPR) repeat protein